MPGTGVSSGQYGATVYLSRKRIIAAAMDLAEREGVEAVTMQRLATDLGCGLVSLYNYVPSTSALLDGVADAVMRGIELPASLAGWREQFREQAMAFRKIAKARPRCMMMVLTRRPSSAEMLRPLERALETLHDAGFDGEDAVRIVRAVIAYVMGSVLGETEIPPRQADADDGAIGLPRMRKCEFPHLTRLGADETVSDPEADFEFGLDLLLRSAATSARQPV